MLKKVLVDYCVYYSRITEGLSSVFYSKTLISKTFNEKAIRCT